jgi:hypothetical protein
VFSLKRGRNEVKMRKLARKGKETYQRMAGSAVYGMKKAKISLEKHNKRAKYILERQSSSHEKPLPKRENGGKILTRMKD